MTTTAQMYRSASLQHASHLDLLLATYDALAQDLRLAGFAVKAGNIAERCRLSNHALLLIGHLESWTSLLGEPALESSLAQFYLFVRGEVLKAQIEHAVGSFASLAMLVCEIRAAWQQKGAESDTYNNKSQNHAQGHYAFEQQSTGNALSFSA